MISPVTCKFNSLPSIQVTNTTGSSRSASPASPAKQKPRKESPSAGARGCCTPQRSQSLQPIRHSNNCPMIKKQQDQRSLCQRQQEQYNLQQLHRVQQPQTSSQCCSLHQSQMMANSSFNHDQRLCPMNQNLATGPADYRHECLMAIASMRNNLYEGTQKVMQCIQILNGLDHFLRNTKWLDLLLFLLAIIIDCAVQ